MELNDIIYLEEGQDRLRNCPKCNSEVCFLPDILSSPKPWGRLTVYKWHCHSCKTEIFQTKRNFNLDTVEGSTAYLESEGIDVEQCVKDGLAEIEKIKACVGK